MSFVTKLPAVSCGLLRRPVSRTCVGSLTTLSRKRTCQPKLPTLSLRRGHQTLAHGRFTSAAPGPTPIPDEVLQAMHKDTTNYGAVLQMGNQISADLRQIAGTSHHVKVYPGNGHLGWQSALANTLSEGDHVVVVDSKGFSHLWGMCAESEGLTVKSLESGAFYEPVPADTLERCLREDIEHKIKAVLVAHTETDFTVHHDLHALRVAIDSAGHPALFMVDCVPTFGCCPIEMDACGIDVIISTAQKGLMLPPGLAIMAFSEKALEMRRQKKRVPMFLDWLCGMTADPKGHWTPGDSVPWISPGTPPTNLLLGLQASLDIILRQHGLEQTFARHEVFARATWAAVDAWGRGSGIRCFVPNTADRSPVVTLVKAEGVDVARLRQWCLEEANLLVPGAGLGFLFPPGQGEFQADFNGSDAFRISHMGFQNASMLLGTLSTIDLGFKALEVQHGANALNAAAEEIAKGWMALQGDAREVKSKKGKMDGFMKYGIVNGERAIPENLPLFGEAYGGPSPTFGGAVARPWGAAPLAPKVD